MSRLERDDAYLRSFTAAFVAERTDDEGRWWRLEPSAFYATGGGQLHDEGALASADGGARWRVVGVESDADGTVWHRVEGDAPAPAPGAGVLGEIDWPRRWRHMQRHTAQHLVSQAFVRQGAGYGTRAVSLTSPDVTVDLAGDPDDDAVRRAFRLANEVAARNLAIDAFEVDEADLGAYPLRRPAKVRGSVRLVRVGDWELSACGGTHVRATAEVLPLLLLATERIRGGLLRVTFRAGVEAIEHAQATHDAASAAARALSSGVPDLVERVAALQAEASGAKRDAAGLRRRLAAARASALVTSAGEVVAAVLEGDDADLVSELADAVAALGASAVVGAAHGERASLVIASGDGRDVRPALRAGLALLDGRGGGRPERAQGAGPAAERLGDAVAAAREALAGS